MEQIRTERGVSVARVVITSVLIVLAVGAVLLLLRPSGSPLRPLATGQANIIALIPVAFIAGLLAFLSPCTLPILPAYFAFTFGTLGSTGPAGTPAGGQLLVPATAVSSRGRVLLSSVAFFAGLASTMVIIGASLTALGQLIGTYREQLARIGGVVIIIFGLMSLLGKGFGGFKLGRQRSTSLTSAYLYGMTFALGWTACTGPVLGMITTLLLTQGGGLLAGALLSFVYVLGLGLPLIIVATFFSHLGQGSRFWRILRGRGWELRLLGRSLYLHSTSVISGLLMILVGVLLATDQLASLNQYASTGPAEWALKLERPVMRFFGLER